MTTKDGKKRWRYSSLSDTDPENLRCISPTATDSCLMNGPKNGQTEFCWSGNHVGSYTANGITHKNEQDHFRGQSCWDTMVARVNQKYGLNWTAPTANPVSSTTGHDKITVEVIQDLERLILCIDESGSMDGEKINYAMSGARLFVDLADIGDKDIYSGSKVVPAPGESVGVVSFTSSASVLYPLTEMENETTKASAQNAVNGLSANDGTGIGAGLQQSLQMFEGAGAKSPGVGEHIVLLSDGVSGDDPSAAVASLKARKVPVYTIGLGSDVDEGVIRSIASETGGSYYYVKNAVDLWDAFLKIKQDVRKAHATASWTDTITQGAVSTTKMTIDTFSTITRWVLNWGGVTWTSNWNPHQVS